MEDIDKVIAEETRLIDTSASIHQQEVDYKIASKMTIKELQTIGKVKQTIHTKYFYLLDVQKVAKALNDESYDLEKLSFKEGLLYKLYKIILANI